MRCDGYDTVRTERSMGKRTTFSLLPTERTSRMIVSITGSSKVERGAKNSLSCCWTDPPAIVDVVCCCSCGCCCCWAGTPFGLAHWGPPTPGFICCGGGSCCAISLVYVGYRSSSMLLFVSCFQSEITPVYRTCSWCTMMMVLFGLYYYTEVTVLCWMFNVLSVF